MSDWADDIAADVLKRLREDDYASFTTVVAAHLRAHVDDLMAERDRLKAALTKITEDDGLHGSGGMRYEMSLSTVRNGEHEVNDVRTWLQNIEGAVARGGRVVQWMQSSACHPHGQLATVMTAIIAFDDSQAT